MKRMLASRDGFLFCKLQITKLQIAMPDPSEQLQRIYAAGFELATMERFPRSIAVQRGNCIALLESGDNGLRLVGPPGWRMGEVLGVLVKKDGRNVFQNKSEVVEATPERLAELDKFKQDLNDLLSARA
jgi:hypothetical protein